MYIEHLHLTNFRCFAKTKFSLNYPGKPSVEGESRPGLDNVNLFLGDNGAGKTSVFRATTIMVLAQVIGGSGFISEFFIRRPQGYTPALHIESCHLKGSILAQNTDWSLVPIGQTKAISPEVTLELWGDNEALIFDHVTYGEQEFSDFYFNDSSTFFVCAYGASRRTERPEGYSERNRRPRYQRVAGLFEDHVGLAPLTYAALELDKKKRLDESRELLNRLLPADVQMTAANDKQERPLFSVKGTLLPFNALSDGYRTFIGWVWDLLLQMARVAPEGTPLTDLPGVVIVDEIDLFLHPEWQKRVVEDVAKTFPRLQFLFSTHSPLVAGTVEAANIYSLEDDPDNEGAMIVTQYRERIHGLSADQILTSSYFGLDTTRAKSVEDELDTIADRAADGDPDAAVAYLRRLREGNDGTASAPVEALPAEA